MNKLLQKGWLYRYHEINGWEQSALYEGDIMVRTGFGGGHPYRLGVLEGDHKGAVVWHFGNGLEEIGPDPKAMEHILEFETQYQAEAEKFSQEEEAPAAEEDKGEQD